MNNDINLAQEVARLTSIVGQLQLQLKKFQDSAQYTFSKNVQILDGRNIKLGGTQGTQIGQTASKMGFFGHVPVVKQTGPTTVTVTGTANDSGARQQINNIITLLQAYGLL